MRRFDLIAFDWDGTLFDSTRHITRAIQNAVVAVGGARPSDEQASYVIGLGLMQALAHAAPDVSPDKYPELAQHYGKSYMQGAEDINLFDGVLDLLHTLRGQGFKLAVATGKTRQGLNNVLSRDVVFEAQTRKLGSFFDTSRTADETRSKPHPQMLHELMEALSVPAGHTLMVGDTTHDLDMATKAGCASVGVSFGAHSTALLERASPLAIVHSVAELRSILLG